MKILSHRHFACAADKSNADVSVFYLEDSGIAALRRLYQAKITRWGYEPREVIIETDRQQIKIPRVKVSPADGASFTTVVSPDFLLPRQRHCAKDLLLFCRSWSRTQFAQQLQEQLAASCWDEYEDRLRCSETGSLLPLGRTASYIAKRLPCIIAAWQAYCSALSREAEPERALQPRDSQTQDGLLGRLYLYAGRQLINLSIQIIGQKDQQTLTWPLPPSP